MKKFFSVLISLILVFICSVVFADNMSQSEIISYFNDNVSSEINVSSYIVINESDILSGINSYIESYELSDLSNNYLYFCYNDDDDYYNFYDLGDAKIINCSYSNYTFTMNLDSSCRKFAGYSNEEYCFENTTVNSIQVPINLPLPANTFNGLFHYVGNIFVEDSGGGLFDNIIAIMTSILAFIVPIATGLLAIPLFKFIIYASVCIGIILFVIKLIRRFVPVFGRYGNYRNYREGKYIQKYGSYNDVESNNNDFMSDFF